MTHPLSLSRLIGGNWSMPPALPSFDSTTVFVRATASYLRGEPFPALGMLDSRLTGVTPLLNQLPQPVRQFAYTRVGTDEGIAPDSLSAVDIEALRKWVIDQYPKRGYPAVLIGSSNGAAVHLAAALGIPFLPQTFLIPVKRSLHPDAIGADIAWGRQHAPAFLAANPDVSLFQMHDPNQDRRMVGNLAYFRTKLRRLGPAYESFLETVLEPGGTVVVLECDYEWPAIDLGDRHTFQLGGLGGLEPREYYEGSDRIARFLAEQGSNVREWNVPEPDSWVPEAEWGFEPALRPDIKRVTAERDYNVRRLSFEDPRDLSPFVADLYRHQYHRDRPTDRLLIQSFALVEPWWTIRTGSVPYWSAFTTQPDVRFVESYLEDVDPYDDIRTMLFSHGVDSAGLASIDRWRDVLKRGRKKHGFIGVDTAAYPHDVETHIRYHGDLPAEIDDRCSHPPPLSFDRFDAAAAEWATEYGLEWIEE